jgi:hypothetical protein
MNRSQARDQINTFVTDAFGEATTAVLGAAGELRYQGIRPPDGVPLVPPNDAYWARVTLQVAAEYQETLRCDGTRRFVTAGSVIVQMFFPTLDVNAQPNLDVITEMVRNRFRTHPSAEIEFTGSRVDDNIPAEPNWLRANIVSQFAYRQFI